MNLRDLLLRISGEEEEKIKHEEEQSKDRKVVKDGFHLVDDEEKNE